MAGELSWRANHVTSRGRAVGGKLLVEGDRLVFQPHFFDRALRANEWSAALAEVSAVEVAGRDPKGHLFSGGLRRQLAVHAGGEEHRFVVNGVENVAAALRGALPG